ncbi:MAG TPA: aldehyde dehydrogenase family protein, partial [Saprospiraceae bacterium]|nr:aldehyde dehydrogenase family protein [Saprospiraceae bacterium]
MLKDSSLIHRSAFINNEWTEADSGATFIVTNPATGEELARVADCGAAETRRAIAAAEAALPDWRAKT